MAIHNPSRKKFVWLPDVLHGAASQLASRRALPSPIHTLRSGLNRFVSTGVLGVFQVLGLFALFALLALFGLLPNAVMAQSQSQLPLFDGHLHYSHDAVELVPPEKAVAILRAAGLKYAVVSSSNDEGTQKLRVLAPDMILPSLRPYRSRADTSSWLQTDAVVTYMKERLAKYRYVAIGEFHVSGEAARSPIMKTTVALAKQYQLILHAHADSKAIEILFELDPNATILWAHSGFDQPDAIAAMLKKYPRLFADLAFRNDYASGGELDAAWRKLFEAYPDRFMAGTDTYTPERWAYIGEYASWMRQWLGRLPSPLKEKIAFQNGEALFKPYQARLADVSRSDLGIAQPCSAAEGWLLASGNRGSKLYVKAANPPALSKLFIAQLSTCSDEALSVKALDIVMPAHRHGMNYKPEIKQINSSTAQASGLLMHMPGQWQWQIDAQTGSKDTERFTALLTLQ